jgi:hypothetical protein
MNERIGVARNDGGRLGHYRQRMLFYTHLEDTFPGLDRHSGYHIVADVTSRSWMIPTLGMVYPYTGSWLRDERSHPPRLVGDMPLAR